MNVVVHAVVLAVVDRSHVRVLVRKANHRVAGQQALSKRCPSAEVAVRDAALAEVPAVAVTVVIENAKKLQKYKPIRYENEIILQVVFTPEVNR